MKIFALFGNPTGQSLSPLMHNAAYSKMEIDACYVSFCVENIENAVRGIRGLNICGVSVTIPFKTTVMEYLDEIDDSALKIGAVNTILNRNGRLTGHNTDWMGLTTALKESMEIEGKNFVILGAGGTARSAVYAILNEGGIPIILNRTIEKGKKLAAEFGCESYHIDDIEKIKADCLINTTPVGMTPDTGKSPVENNILTNFKCVMDVIYNPLRTKLLKNAEKAGCTVLSGLDMFVHQGAEQIKMWTGIEPPREFMRQIVLEKLKAS
ncbi:MAG: shikimate dehydrogenase [Thermodesulfobacteriota bacterium]|nr:shikimate dehydrogenase [Thermodesulfobacteriota bacterium]